uniref:Uncharacterized protein n=1 Tax=Candidatus Kentrum sp. TC TaxID=2126339 RepID=A0A450ZKY0_9GAMM|nr:MAG: hypothetical protein BECKTC1821F_GA0114240_100529 [Candidatus Kentron sp. TC]
MDNIIGQGQPGIDQAHLKVDGIGNTLFVTESPAFDFERLEAAIPSAGPLPTFRTMAFKIPHGCSSIVLATFFIGSKRQGMVHDSRRFQALRAQLLHNPIATWPILDGPGTGRFQGALA